MSENCNHECEGCTADCSERQTKEDFSAKLNEQSHVKKTVGILSGKGGVGKSLITALLATGMQRRGHTCAILDADITGPSIPTMFGIHEKAQTDGYGIYPAISKTGIKIISINLMLENDTDPVVWRGPVLSGVVKQFWTDVVWGDVDYMFVDMPPGTGDVPLTVFQSLPVDALILAASPQQMVSMIVSKAVNMAEMMHIPILGLIENMSYITCPDCGKEIRVFGESHIEDIAKEHGLSVLASLPFEPKLSAASDKGLIELFEGDWLEDTYKALENLKAGE
jgi:Mrp family chromosome partitioning ATPase